MAEEGICRLTNTHGRFVRSHLIPAALTRPVVPGAPLIQHQSGRRLSRRWTSWHDEELVTRTGEDILSDLDNWAIAALRRQSMIWSGWGRVSTLPATHAVSRMSAIALRCLEPGTMDFARLRLFLLSLLWRAAATSRPEFCEVQMPDEHLEVLRRCLVTRQCPDNDFYPASCTQLSTRGITQNQVPLAETKPVPSLTGPEMQLLPTLPLLLRWPHGPFPSFDFWHR